ncbi:hypothetical protein MBLNU230_g7800t1 [Neophaeotheca triangularis]
MSYPRNPSPNPKRNLKPVSTGGGAYSASPSQLTLSSDIPSAGLPNPYAQSYNAYAPHNPSGFAFQQPTHYGHPPPPLHQPQHHQTTQQHYTHQPQQQQHPHQHQQPQQTPNLNSRKRRASELGEPGSASSNASAFGQPPASLMSAATAPGDLDVSSLSGPSQPQNPSPVAKKGRTNTPWTPAEEQRLKTLRDAGSSWSEIAKTFPTRTEGSVKKHWYKDMHYAEFAEDEVSNFSAALLQAIKDYENNKWKVIGTKVGKPAKACEQFAKEQGWKV